MASTNNTIFDDVFRTLIEKMPELTIPLINEIFGTAYPEDIEIIQRRNEHQTKQGEIITDSHLLIAEKMYHLECQSTQDSGMVVRMIEYDFSISLESMEKEEGRYLMYFPHSCILYLRGNEETRFLTIEVVMPDKSTWEYKVPAVYAGHYTKEEILGKRLFFLLPFYIMRYEKKDLDGEHQELKKVLEEYAEIEARLEKEFLEEGKEKEYRDLIELIIRIAEYILKDREKTRKGFGEVMGGKVLELESDKLIQKGLEQGRTQGLEQGIKSSVWKLLKNGLSVEETAKLLELPKEQVCKIQAEMNNPD